MIVYILKIGECSEARHLPPNDTFLKHFLNKIDKQLNLLADRLIYANYFKNLSFIMRFIFDPPVGLGKQKQSLNNNVYNNRNDINIKNRTESTIEG